MTRIFGYTLAIALLLACIAWGADMTAHDKDADKHHTHYTKPHAHVHGEVYTFRTVPATAPQAPSDEGLTSSDIALGIVCILVLFGLGFWLGYAYGRIGT